MSRCPKCGGSRLTKLVVRGVSRLCCERCGPLPRPGGPIDR